MKSIIRIGLIACLFVVNGLFAQQSLVGKYSGNYLTPSSRGEQSWGFELEITSEENGIVKGLAKRHGSVCYGESPMEGTYKNGKLVMRGKLATRGGECVNTLNVTAEGNTLVGKLGSFPIELRK